MRNEDFHGEGHETRVVDSQDTRRVARDRRSISNRKGGVALRSGQACR